MEKLKNHNKDYAINIIKFLKAEVYLSKTTSILCLVNIKFHI